MSLINLHKVSLSLVLASVLGVGAAIVAPAPVPAGGMEDSQLIVSSPTLTPSAMALATQAGLAR